MLTQPAAAVNCCLLTHHSVCTVMCLPLHCQDKPSWLLLQASNTPSLLLNAAATACCHCLCLLQLLIGFIRPPAASDAARSLWQLVHAMFGRSVLMLGVINVFIGIYLLSTLYKGKRPLYIHRSRTSLLSNLTGKTCFDKRTMQARLFFSDQFGSVRELVCRFTGLLLAFHWLVWHCCYQGNC